jgi:hypothetical protein
MAEEKKDVKPESKPEKKEKKGAKKRYTPKEKEKLMARYTKLRDNDMKAAEAAERVGVPYITLNTWFKAAKPVKKTAAKKKAKKAAPKKKNNAVKDPTVKKVLVESSAVFTLVLPSGMRVECPTAADVAAVVKGLS